MQVAALGHLASIVPAQVFDLLRCRVRYWDATSGIRSRRTDLDQAIHSLPIPLGMIHLVPTACARSPSSIAVTRTPTFALSVLIIISACTTIVSDNVPDANGTSEPDASDTAAKHGIDLYPPDGKILHMGGQTREDFADYLESVTGNGADTGRPAGVAFYSNLFLWGFNEPRAYGEGDHSQDLTSVLAHYDKLIPQVYIWADEQELLLINSGAKNAAIAALGHQLRSYNRPIYLRFGGEFDDGRYRDPAAYKNAYRKLVDGLTAMSVRNVSYVWQSIGVKPTYQDRDISEWYPGDAYVNWVGISVFQIGQEGYYDNHNRARVVEFAREKQLPVMIVESSAIRLTANQKQLTGQAYWDYWYQPYFEFIENTPEVRAFSIINTDWDSQNQFKHLDWGDCQIKSDAIVLQHWRSQLQNERYLHSSEQLYQQLGY